MVRARIILQQGENKCFYSMLYAEIWFLNWERVTTQQVRVYYKSMIYPVTYSSIKSLSKLLFKPINCKAVIINWYSMQKKVQPISFFGCRTDSISYSIIIACIKRNPNMREFFPCAAHFFTFGYSLFILYTNKVICLLKHYKKSIVLNLAIQLSIFREVKVWWWVAFSV